MVYLRDGQMLSKNKQKNSRKQKIDQYKAQNFNLSNEQTENIQGLESATLIQTKIKSIMNLGQFTAIIHESESITKALQDQEDCALKTLSQVQLEKYECNY